MIKKQGLILALIFTVLLQAACTASADACPTPASDTKLFTNAEDGYCLLYPAEYSTVLPHFIVLNPAVGPGDVLGDAWTSIDVESANDRTAAQSADEEIASAGPGLNIRRTGAKVDGEKAVIVDGLPGQDGMRKVFIVHGDRLYTLTFAPWLANARDLEQPTPLGELYTTIMDTLYFLPPTKALPTPTQLGGPAVVAVTAEMTPTVAFMLTNTTMTAAMESTLAAIPTNTPPPWATIIPAAGDLGWGSVYGTIFGGDTNLPLEGATVTCEHFSDASRYLCNGITTTDRDGNYSFTDVFFHDTDRITLLVEAPGYTPWRFEQGFFTRPEFHADLGLFPATDGAQTPTPFVMMCTYPACLGGVLVCGEPNGCMAGCSAICIPTTPTP